MRGTGRVLPSSTMSPWPYECMVVINGRTHRWAGMVTFEEHSDAEMREFVDHIATSTMHVTLKGTYKRWL